MTVESDQFHEDQKTTSRRWMFVLIFIPVLGMLIFGATTQILRVPDNSADIVRACKEKNKQLKLVNSKFRQLTILFDQSLKDNPEELTPETAKFLADFNKPIPLPTCESSK